MRLLLAQAHLQLWMASLFFVALIAVVNAKRLSAPADESSRYGFFSGEQRIYDVDEDLRAAGEAHTNWAVLVAGSSGYYNYRHQADICHAYHTLRNHGIPANRIITMMYDDIAKAEENPFPGKIFNSPAMKDVYAGVRIDYRGDDVTPENFAAVLTGNQSATQGGNGRVLQSNGAEKVFIFFADHGGTGVLLFPNSMLTVHNLTIILWQMHSKNAYKELTIYVEACESGSMFHGLLPEDMNIYAVTASNARQSSYACFCEVGELPCLGDLFSVNWMQDSDKENLRSETLRKQYGIVSHLTNTSHVCHYGNEEIWNEFVSEFQGVDDVAYTHKWQPNESESPFQYSMWSSQDAPILEMIRLRDAEMNPNKAARLTQQIHVMQKKRLYLETKISGLVERIVHDENNRNRVMDVYPNRLHHHVRCHHDTVHTFHRECFDLSKNPYAAKYIYVLANLCEFGIDSARLTRQIGEYCAALGDTSDLRIL